MNGGNLNFFKALSYKPGTILDVGSRNINGELRGVLPVTLGIDMLPGSGVNRVLNAEKLIEEYGPESFDNVVSANTLEHCNDWKSVILNMFTVCRTGGTIAVTTCTKRKGRHDYGGDYWRFTVNDLQRVFEGNTLLATYEENNIWVGVAFTKTGELKPILVEAEKI